MRKRTAAALLGIATVVVALGGAVLAVENGPSANSSVRAIKVTARFFVFTPAEIVIKKDQPVTFELTTLDFGHGFSVPDLGFRADFVPGRTNIVRLTPRKSGRFELLCDNFCGAGHEKMEGYLLVED